MGSQTRSSLSLGTPQSQPSHSGYPRISILKSNLVFAIRLLALEGSGFNVSGLK